MEGIPRLAGLSGVIPENTSKHIKLLATLENGSLPKMYSSFPNPYVKTAKRLRTVLPSKTVQAK